LSEEEKAKITRRKYLMYGGGIVVVAVVAAAGYGIYEATKPPLTTPTPTPTAKLREVLVAQLSTPLDARYNDIYHRRLRGEFTLVGESVKVVIKVIPTLETRNYAMRITCLIAVMRSVQTATGVVAEAYSPEEYWKFEDGTYVKELFINFKKEANMKYVLMTGTSFRVTFEGPDIEGEGHVADLEILGYDLQP